MAASSGISTISVSNGIHAGQENSQQPPWKRSAVFHTRPSSNRNGSVFTRSSGRPWSVPMKEHERVTAKRLSPPGIPTPAIPGIRFSSQNTTSSCVGSAAISISRPG